jgi:hypothetical protein
MPLVSLGFSPTAIQAERDGQLTPLRNPLDLTSWSECPVERPHDIGLRGAAAPEFTLDLTVPTPMHWPAEVQATPLKVVIGMNVMALADVMKKSDPVAMPTRVSTSIEDLLRMARKHEFVIVW